MHKTPANIKAKIAKDAKNLFFISNLPYSPTYKPGPKPNSRNILDSPIQRKATAMPKHDRDQVSKLLIFNRIDGVLIGRRSPIQQLLADLSRCGGFQPIPPRSVGEILMWGQPPSAVQSSEARLVFAARYLACAPCQTVLIVTRSPCTR
jgi:hypothetical protein